MKRLLASLFILLFAYPLFSGDIAEILQWQGYKRSKTTITQCIGDTLSILGASDSLYSLPFKAKDYNSMQVYFTGGTTANIYYCIQACNGDNDVMSENWKAYYWLYWTGSGHDSCYVNTASTVNSKKNAYTSVFPIPALGAGWFRICVYSGATQSGNTRITNYLYRRDN
jgi:hypothetical protein